MRLALPRFALVAAAALLCGAGLAGCTARQSRDQYGERLEQALATRAEVTGQMEREDLRSATEYARASHEVTASLEELDADPPPRGLGAAHERMVTGLEGLAALLARLGRCESLARASAQDRRACRQSIDQQVYDEIRNDFDEADTIYRQEGFSLSGLGGGGDEGGGGGAADALGDDPSGGDEL